MRRYCSSVGPMAPFAVSAVPLELDFNLSHNNCSVASCNRMMCVVGLRCSLTIC